MMKKNFLVLLLMLSWAAPSSAALKPGDAAPGFSLRDRHGRDFFLSDVVGPRSKGKTGGIILTFFASWCAPCRKELPLINAATDGIQARGLSVVIVGLKEDFDAIETLLAELKIDKPVVLSDRYGKTAEKYQVRLLPVTFFIGGDGKVKDIIFGEIRSEKELWDGAAKLMR